MDKNYLAFQVTLTQKGVDALNDLATKVSATCYKLGIVAPESLNLSAGDIFQGELSILNLLEVAYGENLWEDTVTATYID